MKPSHTILSVILLLASLVGMSQVELVPFSSYDTNTKNRLARRGTDTLQLPFTDNFLNLELKDHWEVNQGVFINNHHAVNMPNVGFMTFDGRDGTGEAYQFLASLVEIDGVGDEITSCPIDLGRYGLTDGVGISFAWQLGSPFTDIHKPELDRGDALVLQFKDNEGIWRRVWPTTERLNEILALENSLDPEFRLPADTVLLENVIVEERYLHAGFQFRFQYNGILTGVWDMFSVDNIVLDSGLVMYGTDTTFRESDDYAISKVPESLLKGYVTMPYSHFLPSSPEGTIRDSVSGSVYSLDTLFINDQDSSITIQHNNQVLFADVSRSLSGNIARISRGKPEVIFWELDKPAIKSALDQLVFTDSAELQTTIELITPDTIKSTDSGSSSFKFNNYYARDDGTIEAGAAFIGPGELVMAFDILQDDVLSGIQVYFPKIGQDFENTFITFKIYSSLEGIDGSATTELLYQQDDVVSYSRDSITLNRFLNIPFSTEQSVSAGRYYLGYESLTRSKIQIGIDLNNDFNDFIFFRLYNDPWLTTDIPGAMAIRPVISSLQVPTNELAEELSTLELFPNPVSSTLWLNHKVEYYEVISVTGETILSSQEATKSINTSSLEPGAYLLKSFYGNSTVTSKFIKN